MSTHAATVALIACVGLATAANAQNAIVPDSRPTSSSSIDLPIALPSETEVVDPEKAREAAAPAAIPLEAPIDPSAYVCGPGDGFELHFWGRQNFLLRLGVDLEGRAFVSKLGYVKVAGLTLDKVRENITRAAKRHYPGVEIDLVLSQPRTFLVHIVGEVKKPGVYRARALERVSTVLEREAGMVYGSRRQIAIHRRDGSRITGDLLRYELSGNPSLNPYLLDGDVIEIPTKHLVVSISGPVQRPGTYELVDTKDLAELVDLAGGLKGSVARQLPIRIVRNDDRQHAAYTYVPFGPDGALPSALLRDEDNVIVRGTDELQRTILITGAVLGADKVDAAAFSKRVTYIEGDTVRTLIERAGGITASGDLTRAYIERPTVGGEPQRIPVNLDALLVRRDFREDKPVHVGDQIVIPTVRRSIFVEGAVTRAGSYEFNPRFGISEYISNAGGRTRTARELTDVKLIRPSGVVVPYRRDAIVAPGDTLVVPERNFTRPEIVQIVVATATLVVSSLWVGYTISRGN
ncbi:MAG TPA: SLBB domain-containing protein [Kofleriaceae bacterium]|jgi:protein involved in polysaccharide export with SLBB domain|nr:SLBB domain-containing protein [Kofleriaceae bacterium]